jgi:hypothetical protein
MMHIPGDYEPQPAQYQGKRVLLCENNPLVGMCIASVLQEFGIEVTGPISLTLTHILLGKLKIIRRDTDQCFRIRVMPQEIRYPN